MSGMKIPKGEFDKQLELPFEGLFSDDAMPCYELSFSVSSG